MPTAEDLFALLACPACKSEVLRERDRLACRSCDATYPIVDGVPVLLLGGGVPPKAIAEPNTYGAYFPWIYRVVLQSLLDHQPVLEIGSGNRALDDPCIVRMDVNLTPHVDVVGDVHHLPFRPGVFDFVFSLAVLEHLRQPFDAAAEIRRVVRDGGYVYHECNFVFAYHAYPHHYMNTSVQGIEQVLGGFRRLRTGVAPYQMPSSALQMVVTTYLQQSSVGLTPEGLPFVEMLQRVLDSDLVHHDRYFTEAAAANVAAGVFFFGLKQETPGATVIPSAVWQAWQSDATLRLRFPEPLDLGRTDNLLRWAAVEGSKHPLISGQLGELEPFNKRGRGAPFARGAIRGLPFVEPRFGTLHDYPADGPPPKPQPTGWRRRVPRIMRRWANQIEKGERIR